MRLVGLSAVVPKDVVPITEAYAHFPQADIDRIVANIGVRQHREVTPGTTAADMAIEAGRALLADLGWEPSSVDLCLFVSLTFDQPAPGTATRIQHALGLRTSTMALDVILGCSGFTHGLLLAESLLASGLAKRALLFCGEATTHHFRPGIRDCRTVGNLGNSLLFGDAASCAALEAGPTQVRARVVGADGGGYDHISVPAGGARRPIRGAGELEFTPDAKGEPRRPIDIWLNGTEVFTFSIRRVPPMFDEAMKQSGWTADDVGTFVFHQANKFMLEFLRKKLKLPEDRVPLTIEDFGNTSSASIPLTMVARRREALATPHKLLLLGFGIGFSWSAVALETEGVRVLPLIEI
jgi:3-oxoacyl-[acyl-carrier-protein] synthase-3